MAGLATAEDCAVNIQRGGANVSCNAQAVRLKLGTP